MKKLTFIVALLLSFNGFSQGVLTSAEIKGAILTITPSNMQSRSAGNLPIQSLKVKRLRLDTLLKVASENITLSVADKADLSYVNTQLAGKTSTVQVNAIVSPKMDSVRVKSLLTLKADLTALNSKVETSTFNSALATKANSSDLALKANTTDVNALLNFKAPTLNPTFTGTVSGITPAMIGLGNVSNISDANKEVSIATQAALNLRGSLGGSNIWTGQNTFQNLKLFTHSLTPSSTSENYAFGNFVGSTPSVAGGISYGQINQMTYSGSSLAAKIYGLYSVLRNSGNGSDVFSAVEAQVENVGTGTTQSAYGVRTTATHTGTGTTVDLMGIKVNPNTKTAGTVTNNWGIHIASQNISGAFNSGLFMYGNGTAGRISWGNGSNTSTLNLYQSTTSPTTLETDGTISALSGGIIRAGTDYNLRVRNATAIGGTAALALHSTNNTGSQFAGMNIESSDLRINAYQGGVVRIAGGGGFVTIGTNEIDGSAILSLNSTTRGLLIPRMNTTQRDAIPSPAEGLEIFNTTTKTKDFFNGTAWGAVGELIGTISATSGAIIRASTGYNLRVRNATAIGGTAALALHSTNDAGSQFADMNIESSDLRINAYQGGITRINTGGGVVTIGGNAISGSGVLELNSTTKGFLIPRMNTTQRDAISSPAEGLEIFNTTTKTKDYFNGTVWKTILTN